MCRRSARTGEDAPTTSPSVEDDTQPDSNRVRREPRLGVWRWEPLITPSPPRDQSRNFPITPELQHRATLIEEIRTNLSRRQELVRELDLADRSQHFSANANTEYVDSDPDENDAEMEDADWHSEQDSEFDEEDDGLPELDDLVNGSDEYLAVLGLRFDVVESNIVEYTIADFTTRDPALAVEAMFYHRLCQVTPREIAEALDKHYRESIYFLHSNFFDILDAKLKSELNSDNGLDWKLGPLLSAVIARLRLHAAPGAAFRRIADAIKAAVISTNSLVDPSFAQRFQIAQFLTREGSNIPDFTRPDIDVEICRKARQVILIGGSSSLQEHLEGSRATQRMRIDMRYKCRTFTMC